MKLIKKKYKPDNDHFLNSIWNVRGLSLNQIWSKVEYQNKLGYYHEIVLFIKRDCCS